jgi:hypothetical protein
MGLNSFRKIKIIYQLLSQLRYLKIRLLLRLYADSILAQLRFGASSVTGAPSPCKKTLNRQTWSVSA